MNITPVYVAGNSTIHAGRKIGTYASGRDKFVKLCGKSSRDRHDASPVNSTSVVTCKRCLAKTTAAPAPAKPAAPAVDADERAMREALAKLNFSTEQVEAAVRAYRATK